MTAQSVKGDFFTNFSMQKLTFNEFRKKNKLALGPAFFMIFKSCVGLGIFSYPYAFGKAGYFYGGLLCMMICYMTGYGMYSLATVASGVEKAKFGLKKMHNYDSEFYENFNWDF